MTQLDRKKEMIAFMEIFKDMPDRLLKYIEILLEGKDATPECYQDTMSYRRLAVALTTKCNLSCFWCYRKDPQYKSILGMELDFDLFKRFVDNTSGRFRIVHLAGLGEPTMYPKFLEVIKLSRMLSSSVKVTTNGSLLTPDLVIQYVDAGLTHMEISVDAFEKEKLMKYRGVNLDQLTNIVNYISAKVPLYLQINTVVSTENRNSLAEMVDVFGEAENIRVWHTIPLFVTKPMHDQNVMPLKTEEYQSLLLNLQNKIDAKGLSWKLEPDAYGVRLDPIIEMKKRLNICFTCFEDPYISVKGRFNYCSRQEYSSVADISRGFEKAWNHPTLVEFRKRMLKGDYPVYCGELCFLRKRS